MNNEQKQTFYELEINAGAFSKSSSEEYFIRFDNNEAMIICLDGTIDFGVENFKNYSFDFKKIDAKAANRILKKLTKLKNFR